MKTKADHKPNGKPNGATVPVSAAPRPRRSRATIAEELEAELAGARVFQLFARRLGPGDVMYVSALAYDERENVVEARATAMTLADALMQLFANLDQATQPEDP